MSTDRAARAREKRQRETRAQGDLRRARALARYHAKKEPKPQHIPKIIATVLAAPVLETDAVKALASRDNFAAAVDHLSDRVGWRNAITTPLAILWAPGDPDVIRSHRLALGFELFEVAKGDATRHDRAWLRSLSDPAAGVCLAILGELPDWTAATENERAGFLLGRIVEARRGWFP